jgi:hypothetical protein
MTVINLQEWAISLDELLALAARESVRVISPSGQKFVIEADEDEEFAREVAELGASDRFMNFLAERAKEEQAIPIEQFLHELNEREGAAQSEHRAD